MEQRGAKSGRLTEGPQRLRYATGCSQLVDKLSTVCFTTCYKVVELNRLADVFPTTCYRLAIQQFVNKL